MKFFQNLFSRIPQIDWKICLYLCTTLVGASGLIYGMWQLIQANNQPDIISVDTSDTPRSQLIVEVNGAVNHPGIYTLTYGDRLAQALEQAGGLAKDADPQFVAKNLELASVVGDGQKIYVPFAVASVDADTTTATAGDDQRINLNLASKVELQGLPGIGEVKAQKIIDARPIGTLTQLISENVITESDSTKLKDLVTL